MGFGFFFWVVAALFYSIEDVGEATAIISSLSLVIILSRFGFDGSQIRFMQDYKRETVFNTCLWIPAIGAVVIGGIYFVFLRYITPASAFIHGYFFLFIAIAFLNSIMLTISNAFISFGRADYRFVQNLMLGMRIPVAILFISLGSMGLFLSYGIAYFFTSIFAVWLIVKFVPITFEIDKKFSRETSRFTYLGYLSNIFQMVPVLVMPLLILSVSSADNAALYYIAFAFGSLVLVIPDSIGMLFFVEGSQGTPVKKGIIQAFTITLLILVPAVIFLWFFGENILQWLGKDYSGALDLLRIFLLASFFVSMYQLFLYLQGIRMKVEVGLIFNIIRAILLIILSYFFLLMFGINGIAWAWVLTHLFLCVLIVGYLRNHIANEIKDRSLLRQ
jgi:O-antigen/teichoic acid export membrane protein